MISDVPVSVGMKDMSFWDRLEPNHGDCWIWTGAKTPKGYGIVCRNSKLLYTHRYAYILWNGEVPQGLVLDHLCRNPSCCNPSHLEAVTQQENCLRGLARWNGEEHRKKTACRAGHPFNEHNTRLKPSHGGIERVCKECARLAAKGRRQRNAAKRNPGSP